MQYDFIKYEMDLEHRRVIAIRHADLYTLRCLGGSAWVTQDDGEDIWLRRGEELPLGQGKVVIEALEDLRLQLRRKESLGRHLFRQFSGLWRRSKRAADGVTV